jgi:hypothetical protein
VARVRQRAGGGETTRAQLWARLQCLPRGTGGAWSHFRVRRAERAPLLEGEEWKPYGNAATISNLSRYRDYFGVIKTQVPRPEGYALVQIGGKIFPVHVLVAELFLPLPALERRRSTTRSG